jgi:hypothetical protein
MSRTNGSSGAMIIGSRNDARDGRNSMSNGQRPRTQKQGPKALNCVGVTMVGDTGFEPVTPRM